MSRHAVLAFNLRLFFTVIKIWSTDDTPIGGCFHYAELIERYGSVVFVRYLPEQGCKSALTEAQKLIEMEKDDNQQNSKNVESINRDVSYNDGDGSLPAKEKTEFMGCPEAEASVAATEDHLQSKQQTNGLTVATTADAVHPVANVAESHYQLRQTRSVGCVTAAVDAKVSQPSTIVTDSRQHRIDSSSCGRQLHHHKPSLIIKESSGTRSSLSPLGGNVGGQKTAYEFDIVSIKYVISPFR